MASTLASWSAPDRLVNADEVEEVEQVGEAEEAEEVEEIVDKEYDSYPSLRSSDLWSQSIPNGFFSFSSVLCSFFGGWQEESRSEWKIEKAKKHAGRKRYKKARNGKAMSSFYCCALSATIK